MGRNDVEQIVEVVRDSSREPADRVELLHLPDLLLEPGALGDVAEVGLRHPAAAEVVGICDGLDEHTLARLRPEHDFLFEPEAPREVGLEPAPGGRGVVVEARAPRASCRASPRGKTQELLEKRVHVQEVAGRRVHQPDALARGFENAAVPGLGGAHGRLGSLALGDVFESEEEQRLRLARQLHPPGVDAEDLLADPVDVDGDLVVLNRSILADRPHEELVRRVPGGLGAQQLRKQPALGLLHRGLEHAVKSLVGAPDAVRFIENDEGFADGLHEGLGKARPDEDLLAVGRPGRRSLGTPKPLSDTTIFSLQWLSAWLSHENTLRVGHRSPQLSGQGDEITARRVYCRRRGAGNNQAFVRTLRVDAAPDSSARPPSSPIFSEVSRASGSRASSGGAPADRRRPLSPCCRPRRGRSRRAADP